jgi:hypothetical protein
MPTYVAGWSNGEWTYSTTHPLLAVTVERVLFFQLHRLLLFLLARSLLSLSLAICFNCLRKYLPPPRRRRSPVSSSVTLRFLNDDVKHNWLTV